MIYTTDYIRKLLELDPRVIDDEQISFLIDHYTELIQAKTGAGVDDIDTPLFQNAVMEGIACNLSMTNKGSIIQPNRVKVGYYEEETRSRADVNRDPTWCEMYADSLDDIIAYIQKAYGFKALTRQGAREKRGFY